MKKLSLFLAFAMLLPLFCFAPTAVSAEGETVSFKVKATALNTKFTSGITVYTAEDGDRRLSSMDYNFPGASLLIFSADGRLIEAGGGLLAQKGACQEAAIVPKGGFMIAYFSQPDLNRTKTVAMEGAMLYNATMGIIYPIKGSFNKETMQIEISYEKPSTTIDPNATSILFVGNSSTYFSGTPILFKGLCQAAGLNVSVDYCTFGSAYLSEFANENHERGRALRLKLKGRKYDYIVFQDAAGADLASSVASMKVLMPLTEANGAKPIFYMRYSTYTDEKQGKERVDHYYEIYSRLAADHQGILMPSAYSWFVCMRKYPEINLIADDGGHHSKAGAYIIACSWLYTIFGKDPRGSSYTADLDPVVASELQECAVISCETPYVLNSVREQKLRVGTKIYEDVAAGKSYTRAGEKYDGGYTWIDEKLDGTPMGKLTDNVIATSGGQNAIGATKGGESSVVIDLGAYHAIRSVRTDLWGGKWDVADPTNAVVKLSVSNDGVNFKELGTLTGVVSDADGWKKNLLTLDFDFGTASTDATASDTSAESTDAVLPGGRYVKLDYSTGGNAVWTSEIAVFGEEAEQPAEPEPEPEAEPSGLPVGAIIGIIAGALALVAAAVVVVVILKKKKK